MDNWLTLLIACVERHRNAAGMAACNLSTLGARESDPDPDYPLSKTGARVLDAWRSVGSPEVISPDDAGAMIRALTVRVGWAGGTGTVTGYLPSTLGEPAFVIRTDSAFPGRSDGLRETVFIAPSDCWLL